MNIMVATGYNSVVFGIGQFFQPDTTLSERSTERILAVVMDYGPSRHVPGWSACKHRSSVSENKLAKVTCGSVFFSHP